MSTTERPTVYHPRKPQQSAFWKLLDKYFSSFEQHDAERFAKECGDLREGFARVRCPDCRHEYLLVSSCRGRWFSPCCHSKKGIQFGEHLKESSLFPVPHRQYVLSISSIFPGHFKYDRKLSGKLCRCASKSLVPLFRTALRVQGGVLGPVAATQTFGDYGKFISFPGNKVGTNEPL